MKGYKGMTADMTCRGMKYEIGKTYHEDNIALCERGLHFCKNLRDVFLFYNREDGNRFFEVEATGNVCQGDNKCVASDLTIVRELTDIEVYRYYYSCGHGCSDCCIDLYGCGYGNGKNYNHIIGDYICCNDHYNNNYGNGYGYGNNIQRYLFFKEV